MPGNAAGLTSSSFALTQSGSARWRFFHFHPGGNLLLSLGSGVEIMRGRRRRCANGMPTNRPPLIVALMPSACSDAG